jgi:glutamine phosphoribosylpyrophosphate amidotransferase
MCGIFVSFNEITLNELCNLNLHRGNKDKISSMAIPFNSNTNNNIDITREKSCINFIEGKYNVCHIQSPTNQINDEKCIQPVEYNNNILFHNGMLKQEYIQTVSDKYKTTFDTLIMIKMIDDVGIKSTLENIDGSFACILFYNNELFIFRNNPGILYVDDKLNISSTKFKNGHLIKSNVIIKLDLYNRTFKETEVFATKSKPYFIF